MKFRYWDDASDAVVHLWEDRLCGAHFLVPVMILNDYCNMAALRERITGAFCDHVKALAEGELVEKWRNKMADDMARVSSSLRSRKGNKLGVFNFLCEEKEGLEAKKSLIEKRIREFQYAMRFILDHLEGREGDDVVDGFKVFRLGRSLDWVQLDYLMKRECRRLSDGLPVYSFRRDILRKIHNQQVMVLVGETGSGKSTQLVQFLADSGVSGNGSIVCTQPRKLAAISLAHRVQDESLRCYLDEKPVACCPTSASVQMYNSKVLFMTDHCLLQYYMKDKNLSRFSCIIVDEAHERSLNTDLLLALLKNLLSHRLDLRLIIMSATADAKQLAEYFFNCGSFNVEGRTFPVDIFYDPFVSTPNSGSTSIGSYTYDVLRKVTEIHRTEKNGTILAFLTSQTEVEWACEKFQSVDAVALPLHGKLSHSDQLRVFPDYPGKRKVIFSTNIAETSLTIPGVKYVVDSGMMKESRFEPGTGMNVLKVCPISQSSATQRAGRAGRTEPGKCYRLYSQHDFETMISHQEPEIRRVHLGVAVLRILALGIQDVQSFDFIDAPSATAIDLAIRNLIRLGAVAFKNDKLELTKDGFKLVKLGIEPRLGKLILHCYEQGMGKEGLILAAVMANSSSIFCRVGDEEEKTKSDCRKVQYCHRDGDLFTFLSVYKEWESVPLEKKNNWCWNNSINAKTMRRCQETVSEWETCLQNELNLIIPSYWRWNPQVSTVHDIHLKNAVLSALSENVAMYSGNEHLGYEVALTGKHVQLHPSSSLLYFGQRPNWVVFGDILFASNQYLVCVTAFDYNNLTTLSPRPLFDTSKMEARRLQLKVLTGFGSTLLKRFCGKSNHYLLHLESHVRTMCSDERIGIKVNVDQNEVQLYASSQDMENVISLLCHVLDCEKKRLQNECMEKCLYHGGPGLSPSLALFGAGAEIKHLELEKRCLSVDVSHSDVNTVDDKKLLLFLEDYSSGSICMVHKFTGNRQDSEEKKWGRVTFLTPAAAQKACELNPVEFAGGQLKIVPARSTVGGDHQMSSYSVVARVSWPRRTSKGFGFAKCARQDAAFIMSDLSNIKIGGTYVRSAPSTRDEGCVMIKGLDRMVSEAEVLKVLRASTKRELFDFFLVRGEAVDNPSCGACEEALLREISPFLPKRSPHDSPVSVQVIPPEPKDAFVRAKIMFHGNMHLEAAKALEEIDGKVLPGCFPWQKIRIQHLFHSSLSCSAAVYFVIKEQLDFLLAKFRRRRGAKCCLDLKKTFCVVRISANATKTVAELRRPLELLLHGKTIDDPSLTPSVIQTLFSRESMYLLNSIQRETGTYISFERHSLTLRVFGSPNKIEGAKQKLVHSLMTLYEGKSLEIQLRGGGMPPDLMKKVVYKFGPDLHGLKERFPGSSFTLSARRHIISMCGDKEIKQKVEDVIREIAWTSASLAQEPQNEAACPICLCPVEDNYRLEDCGHVFCRLCLLEQCDSAMKSREGFPLRCMHEGCGAQILLTDLKTLLVGEKLEELFRSSLSSFVASSEGKFRFCPSPDCPSVYQVADPDTPMKTFVCGACSSETCTSCYLESHPFISCERYKEFKEDPDLSLKEWCKGKEHVKECRVCGYTIEKIDGCNHIECRCGRHICWACLEFFANSDDCYDHLRSVHQTII